MKMSLGRLSWQRHKKCQTKQGAKSLLPPQRDPGGGAGVGAGGSWGPWGATGGA